MTAREIEEASAVDEDLIALRQCIKSGSWENCPNPAFKALRHELTHFGKLVLRGIRIVIPKNLTERVVEIAHEGHQGIVKTKERIRTKVWWPGMDKDTERLVRSCHECQIVGQPSVPEPTIRTKFPEGPWEAF